MPNKVQLMADNYEFNIEGAKVWKVKIVDAKNVLAAQCHGTGHDCAWERQEALAQRGTWDILYQQSLLINLEDNTRFIANFQYTLLAESDQSGPVEAFKQPAASFASIGDHDFDRFN